MMLENITLKIVANINPLLTMRERERERESKSSPTSNKTISIPSLSKPMENY